MEPTDHDGLTPGEEATRAAAWHLAEAIEETKQAAIITDHEHDTAEPGETVTFVFHNDNTDNDGG